MASVHGESVMTTDEIIKLLMPKHSHQSKPVSVDGIAYPSIADAALSIGATTPAITAAIKSNRKCKGHKVFWL